MFTDNMKITPKIFSFWKINLDEFVPWGRNLFPSSCLEVGDARRDVLALHHDDDGDNGDDYDDDIGDHNNDDNGDDYCDDDNWFAKTQSFEQDFVCTPVISMKFHFFSDCKN